MRKISIKKVKIKKKKDSDNGPLFSLINDKMDVVVNRNIGGKWKGFKFSELRDDFEGRRLLFWVSNQSFDKKIVALAKEMIGQS